MKLPLPPGYEIHALMVLQYYADHQNSLVNIVEIIQEIDKPKTIDLSDAWRLDRMIHDYLVEKDLINVLGTASGFRRCNIKLKGLWILEIIKRATK